MKVVVDVLPVHVAPAKPAELVTVSAQMWILLSGRFDMNDINLPGTNFSF